MTTAPTSPSPAKKKKRRWGRTFRNWFIGLIGPFVVRTWIRSLRLRLLGDLSVVNGAPRIPPSCICVFWHQRILLLAGSFPKSGFRVLVSQHGDGEMIARVIRGLDMKPIRGSSTRGGARACLEILREKEQNGRLNVGLTPDGPRGPPHVFQEGAIFLASRTGLPIHPITLSARRFLRLPTWDGFILPCPFTRAIAHLGEPLIVPPDIDREAAEKLRQEAERRLRELTESTDRDFNELYRKAARL